MSPLIIIGVVVVGILLVTAIGLRRQNKDVVEERLGRYTELQFIDVAAEEEKKKEKP